MLNSIVGNGGASDLALQGLTPAQDYSVDVHDKTVVASGVLQNTSPWYDWQIKHYAGVIDTNFQINIKQPYWGGDVKVTNLTPGIISLDATGFATVLASGMAMIDVTHPVAGQRLIQQAVQKVVSGNYAGLDTPSAGTLAAHITNTLNGFAAGKTANNLTLDIFNAPNFSKLSPAGTLNTGLWCGVDFSASSFMSASTGHNFPLQLISPRHALYAKHVGFGNGTTILWIDSAGIFHHAYIQSQKWISSDIQLVYLSAAIPSSITPYALLPANWAQYLPSLALVSGAAYRPTIPVIIRSAATGNGPAPTPAPQATVLDLNRLSGTIYSDLNMGNSIAGFGKPIIGGDSSSPAVIPVNGVSVLLSSWWALTPGPNGSAVPPAMSPMYADHIIEIEVGMNTLATAAGDPTTYTLNKVDLSGFTAY